jgi:signal transduction histidine kinase
MSNADMRRTAAPELVEGPAGPEAAGRPRSKQSQAETVESLRRELAALKAERDEALDRQAATSEILRAIAATPSDAEGTLHKIAQITFRLFAAVGVSFDIAEGDEYALAIGIGRGAEQTMAALRAPSATRHPVQPGNLPGTVIRENRQVHLADLENLPPEISGWPGPPILRAAGIRTVVGTPLRREGVAIGVLIVYREELRPFAPDELELLQSFADQAVIGIENSRLLGELRGRTADLQEALEYQTAIGDVLKVISGSVFELQPVLETVVTTAALLCRAEKAILYRYEDGACRYAAGHSNEPEYERIERETPIYPDEGSVAGRAVLHRRSVQIVDALADPLYAAKDAARIGKARSMLGVPLLREGSPVGVLALARERVEPFSDKEIALVTTFADQAVIAIENARLIAETREALEQQTATAEVLGVINASPGDLMPVFDAMLKRALRFCDAASGHLYTYDGGLFRPTVMRGDPEFSEWWHRHGPVKAVPGGGFLGHIMLGEPVVSIADVKETAGYREVPDFKALVDRSGLRSGVGVALRNDTGLRGAITIYRQEVQPFTDKQIALLQNFAAQAVIAMENARLITETREARDSAEAALRDLKVAQNSLIQAEKMASLGQLTAGIAHEIKNPLNFVNNFAALSNELLDELKEIAQPAFETLDGSSRADLDDTIEMLTSNLEKIGEHGRRADNIVKSMLEHSRGVSGERREVDLNGLVDEALNLAYHGARAQDQNFNITLERDFDPALKPVELVPQDITRVFLNLFGNGFYAANRRARGAADASFRPTLRVTTCDAGNAVEIRVRDNGTGIPPDIRDKLFQPFFTTKPTGEGTGLGLSISYDIITQQHNGTISIDSEVGAFTEFTIRLPRR